MFFQQAGKTLSLRNRTTRRTTSFVNSSPQLLPGEFFKFFSFERRRRTSLQSDHSNRPGLGQVLRVQRLMAVLLGRLHMHRDRLSPSKKRCRAMNEGALKSVRSQRRLTVVY